MNTKKFLALMLALVLCLAMGTMTTTASAENEPYEIVWLRYGAVGTDDAQAGLADVQAAVNEWLANNGLEGITVNMMNVRGGDTIQMQLAAKEHIDIFWSNASTLTNTLLAGDFMYDIGGIYKDYEGLYNSMPENIWNTLLRNGGESLYQIPTYKEAGLANAICIKKSDAERFGWEEIIANDPNRIWTYADLEPYLEEATATGDYVQPLYLAGQIQCNGSREYPQMDSYAAITDYIAIDLNGDTTKVQKVTDIPAYQDLVNLMVKYNEAGYIYEGEAFGDGATKDLSFLFIMETLTPDFQGNMDGRYATYDPAGVYCMPMSKVYLTSNAAIGSAHSFASYTPNIDACLKFMDALYSQTELADLCLYGIEGVHYTRLEDGSCQKIADSGYKFATWATSNVMTVSLESTDAKDKKEQYAEFNSTAIDSILLGFVFDPTPVDAEVTACQAVAKEYQKLTEKGFYGVEGLDAYSAALDNAGVQAVIAEVQAQYDAFLAAK